MRILVIKPSSLGDIIHGLQVIAIMKKYLPELIVDWVVRDCWSDIVIASNLVENVFLFHRNGGLRKFINLITDIRHYSYDAVLDMQGLARSGMLTFFSKSKRKIGRQDAREFAGLAYSEVVGLPDNDHVHAMDLLLQFLPKFGLFPKFESCLNFNHLSNKFLALQEENYILLFPESRRKEKQWPYFLELVEQLANIYSQHKIVLVGQHAISREFFYENVVNLTGKTDLLDVLALVKKCKLLVANDSAPIHLGAALSKLVVAFFGPTNQDRFGPYPVDSKKHLILKSKNLRSLKVNYVCSMIKNYFDKFLRDD